MASGPGVIHLQNPESQGEELETTLAIVHPKHLWLCGLLSRAKFCEKAVFVAFCIAVNKSVRI